MGGSVRRRLAACMAAIVTLVLTTGPAAEAAPRAPARVAGIDVSAWQLGIDWGAVATEPVRFVIMRATGGRTYVDPKYPRNLARATARGFVVGAYHWAEPGRTLFDARIEADHFVDVARNAPGDVLPVLDIEQTGGLGHRRLVAWVRTWLERVRDRLGVQAMIYSGPTFWRTNMGNTRWFADHGYPLWVAHWDTRRPDVPAANWGGRGWTFWQRTATARVRGIRTEVDQDRFRRANFVHGRIASLSVEPAPGGVIVGDRIACGVGSAACARIANPNGEVTLVARPEPDARLLRWTGACAHAGRSPTCSVHLLGATHVSAVFGYPVEIDVDGSGGGAVASRPHGVLCSTSCTEVLPAASSVTLRAIEDAASAFAGWSGACTGPDPDCTIAVLLATQLDARFDSVVQREEDGAGTRSTWGPRHDREAIGGSYRWDHLRSAALTFAFTGDAVTLFTLSGPAMGRARVSVDGSAVGTFDGYARTLRGGTRHRYTGFGSGRHRLTVAALGTARGRSRGTRVAVDALRWKGHLHRDPEPVSTRWDVVPHVEASGGRYVEADTPGATSSFRFVGTGVTLRTVRGARMGRAALWLDGERVRVVDLYARRHGFASIRVARGLPDGHHVVRIQVLGTHRRASRGSMVAIDRWVVA